MLFRERCLETANLIGDRNPAGINDIGQARPLVLARKNWLVNRWHQVSPEEFVAVRGIDDRPDAPVA
jgi:hypothetical protein